MRRTLSEITMSGHPPFSNGTERYAWEGKWCAYCRRDHDITHSGIPSGEDLRCDFLVELDLAGYGEFQWPEAWLPDDEPNGLRSLPSRMICAAFVPCTEGECTGDPGAGPRAERVAEVTAHWRYAASRTEEET